MCRCTITCDEIVRAHQNINHLRARKAVHGSRGRPAPVAAAAAGLVVSDAACSLRAVVEVAEVQVGAVQLDREEDADAVGEHRVALDADEVAAAGRRDVRRADRGADLGREHVAIEIVAGVDAWRR